MGCLFLTTVTDSHLKKVPLVVPLQVSLPLFENNFRFLRHWIGDVPALRNVWFLEKRQNLFKSHRKTVRIQAIPVFTIH